VMTVGQEDAGPADEDQSDYF